MALAFADPIQVPVPRSYHPLSLSFIEKTVGKCLAEISEKYPDQPAIIDPDQQITYQTLNHRANQLAHALLSMEDLGGSPIPFLLGRNSEAIIAVFGILKAGKIYLSLEPSNPIDYLRLILKDSQAKVIITNNAHLSLARQLAGREIRIHTLEEMGSTFSGEEPGECASPDSLAAIFYTSGTSGEPKGVVLDQRALLHRSWVHIHLHHLCPDDRSPLPFPLSFAWSITPIYSSLLTGGVLLPCNYAEMQANTLAKWIEKNKLTILHISPSLLRQILTSLPGETHYFRSIRLVNVGSDELYPQDLDAWKKLFPSDGIVAYGLASSEMGTIVRKFFNAGYQPTGNRLPVGYPVPTVNIQIQTPEGREVPPGQVGEIALQSQSIFRGYWGREGCISPPEQAGEPSNQPNYYRNGDMGRILPDGSLEFLGRQDNMLKIRGYRVDTREISAVLVKHPATRETYIAVKPIPHREDEKRLVAYIVTKANEKPTEQELREFLVKHLPMYKVPARFVLLDRLPYTPHGKVDVRALPEPPEREAGSYLAPRTEEEEKIAKIWRDLLGMESIGVEDNFFTLGGDSLNALSMAMEVEKQTGYPIPQSFFQQPTITHLVETLCQENEVHDKNNKVVPRRKKISGATGGLLKGRGRKKKRRWGLHRLVNKDLWSDYMMKFTPITVGRSFLPKTYPEGNRWLLDWCHRPAARLGIYRVKYEMFCNLIGSLENCKINPDEKYPLSLFSNILRLIQRYSLWQDHSINIDQMRESRYTYWKSLSTVLNEAPLSEIDAFFPVSGLDHVKQAQNASGGVILLTYHSSIDRLVSYSFRRRLGLDRIRTISSVDAEKHSPYWEEIRKEKISAPAVEGLHASVAIQGQHLLAQGGIIKMVSDHNIPAGPGTAPAIVAGRQYHLNAGFANLSLITGANIVPYLYNILPDGRIHTSFLSPLNPRGDDRESQLASLIEQYTDFLTMCWKTAPESLFWGYIVNHMKLPSAGNSRPSPIFTP